MGLQIGASAAAASYSGAKAFLHTADGVANNTVAARTMPQELWDVGGWHDTGSNTSRMTVPTGKAGKVRITAQGQFAANTTGTRQARIRKNGTDDIAFLAAPTTATAVSSLNLSVTDVAIVGDYYELMLFQDSGGALNAAGGAAGKETWIEIEFLGA